ncbi:DUF3237 family protein [Sphingobium tyrosinilyticum]|uniref:DUF3237 family protein n=1 Tax=Sphingobium tyrosinilyticum TaxID=2715436 RepID=A0ABV9F1P9_9SPHN
MTFQIPVKHLFSVRLEGLRKHSYDFVGPFGRRRFEKAVGGTVSGSAMTGKVLELLATDYGRVSDDGSLRAYNAGITLQAEDGAIVLLQFRGRSSAVYGPGQSRVQALFQAPEGPFGWLNGIQAVGHGREDGDDTILEIYAVTGSEPAEGPDDERAWAEKEGLPADFILRRRSAHVPGAIRHKLEAPLGSRYFTLAEGGGKFEGPRLGSGDFLSGFAWGPHRMLPGGDVSLMQYDMETFLKADDGTEIFMSYTGCASSQYAKHSWVTAALFEVPSGPHDWMNEVQTVGYGFFRGDGAEYFYYALR